MESRRNARVVLRVSPLLALLAGLPGCVSNTGYPAYWPPTEPVKAAACPDISGRYATAGVYTGSCGYHAAQSSSPGGAYKGEWHCESSLDWALRLGSFDGNPEWFEIRQPDADTIVVTTASQSKVLRRSAGDFDCDEKGIEVTQHESATAKEDQSAAFNTYQGVSMAIFASGGVNSLTRHFRRAADGSLVAELNESSTGLMLGVPYHLGDNRYLRWPVWVEPAPAPPPQDPVAPGQPSAGP